MKRIIDRVAAAATAAVLLAGTTGAFAQAALPKPQTQGTVAYLNGGAGSEEVAFIKQSMKDYTLALAFARSGSPQAEYVASVAVTIKDKKGETVFEAPSVGPYLLLKLPPGPYSVAANYQDQSQTRPVTAANAASAPVTFQWK